MNAKLLYCAAALAAGIGLAAPSYTLPAFAEMTKMVGGAPMYPSKNIIENAVNSKDHTTLVAAVKAAGLVDTLRRRRTLYRFRADQRGVRPSAGRHGRHPIEA